MTHATLIATALALAACGGVANDAPIRGGPITDGGGGRRASEGGATSSVDGGGAIGSGGSASAGGARPLQGTGGTGGREGPVDDPECIVKDDHATIGVQMLGTAQPDEGSGTDDGGTRRDDTLDGVVQEIDATSFVLGMCPLGKDCPASFARVTISAPDLTLLGTGLLPGSLVRVHFVSSCFARCRTSILVTSLKTWNDLTNQHPPIGGDMYVAADDGGGVLPEAPYTWDTFRLSCPSSFEGACAATDQPPGVYVLRFDRKIVVSMGDVGYIPFGGFSVKVRNLRSYESGACDDFAHWAVPIVFGD